MSPSPSISVTITASIPKSGTAVMQQLLGLAACCQQIVPSRSTGIKGGQKAACSGIAQVAVCFWQLSDQFDAGRGACDCTSALPGACFASCLDCSIEKQQAVDVLSLISVA